MEAAVAVMFDSEESGWLLEGRCSRRRSYLVSERIQAVQLRSRVKPDAATGIRCLDIGKKLSTAWWGLRDCEIVQRRSSERAAELVGVAWRCWTVRDSKLWNSAYFIECH